MKTYKSTFDLLKSQAYLTEDICVADIEYTYKMYETLDDFVNITPEENCFIQIGLDLYIAFKDRINSFGVSEVSEIQVFSQLLSKYQLDFTPDKQLPIDLVEHEQKIPMKKATVKNDQRMIKFTYYEHKPENYKRIFFVFGGMNQDYRTYAAVKYRLDTDLIINISDRFLTNGSFYLIDDYGQAIDKFMVKLIIDLISKYRTASQELIFMGASKGGFSAIYLSRYIKEIDKLILLSPITDIEEYVNCETHDFHPAQNLFPILKKAKLLGLELSVSSENTNAKHVTHLYSYNDNYIDLQADNVITTYEKHNQSILNNFYFGMGHREFVFIDPEIEYSEEDVILTYPKRSVYLLNSEELGLYKYHNEGVNNHYEKIVAKFSEEDDKFIVRFKKVDSEFIVIKSTLVDVVSRLNEIETINNEIEITNVIFSNKTEESTFSFEILNYNLDEISSLFLQINSFVHKITIYVAENSIICMNRFKANSFIPGENYQFFVNINGSKKKIYEVK